MPRSSQPPGEPPVPAPPAPRSDPHAAGAPPPPRAPAPPPPAPPPAVPPPARAPVPPPPRPTEPIAAASSSSVKRVTAKETFAPDEPLPAFTFAALDDAQKEALLRRVEDARTVVVQSPADEARPLPQSSVDRVAAKESFSADEPLPAFTFPVLDEDKKLELLRRVEEARGAAGGPPLPPPPEPTPTVRPPPESASQGGGSKLFSESRELAHRASMRASAAARGWVETACAAIDRNRARLPARIRVPLSRVRTGVILAVLMAVALSLVTLGVFMMSGHEKAPPKQVAPAPAAPKEDPVPGEIEKAKKEGGSALEKLAERFPKDYRVWLELATSHSAKGDNAAAVAAVGKAVAADSKANEEKTASDILTAAVRKRETTDAALELLQGPMGAAGATVLYDLANDAKVPSPLRSRAEQWIRSDAFQKVATPDVAMAASLRYAKSCSERHNLLTQAGEKGEQRTLEYLNIVKVPGGCGHNARKDCFPCMRQDSALKDAMSAIQKRVGSK